MTEPLGCELSSEQFPLGFSLAVWQLGSSRACSALEAGVVQGMGLFPIGRALPRSRANSVLHIHRGTRWVHILLS